MSVQIEHLSYSSIQLFLTCPAAWRYRYIEKVQTPTSTALVFGSAWHNAVEAYVGARALGQEADLLALWQQHWHATLESQSAPVDWGAETPEQHFNEGVRLLETEEVKTALDGIVPLVQDGAPVIEKRVELHVPGVPVPVIGYIDIITADGVPGDFKTAARAWSQDKAANELQPAFYLAALNQAGIPTPGMKFRHFVVTKTRKPQFQVLETTRTPETLLFLYQMIGNVWRAIEAEAFPENPTTWKCSPRYCEFWEVCRGRFM
ncbi:MAG TPA: PD-(D/E)XK nuclease family protein [Chloroflexi bacterium]|nr:PD-(D/E)XK nuclease family protein [Chloroflexota bacterium]